MILFHELKIGTAVSGGGVRTCPRCFRATSTAQTAAAEPVRLQALAPRIKELATTKPNAPTIVMSSEVETSQCSNSPNPAAKSVMLRGFEPFQHPDLVDIIQSLAAAKVRRIGMRTDGVALANLRDAQGCIDNGVRVFEIPFLPREMDALSQTAPMEASFAGIQGIRSASAALGAAVFVCADITVCTHTAKYFVSTVQAAIAAGVDAIRLNCEESCDEPARLAELLGGEVVLNQAHSLATQNSTVLFGDGCESYLEGASLYEVISEAAHQQQKDDEVAGMAGEKND